MDKRVILGALFELSAESVGAFASLPDGVVSLPAGTVKTRPADYQSQQVVIFTTITVFESIVLGDYESGLTYPTPMPVRDPEAAPESISFAYQLGPTPGLVERRGAP